MHGHRRRVTRGGGGDRGGGCGSGGGCSGECLPPSPPLPSPSSGPLTAGAGAYPPPTKGSGEAAAPPPRGDAPPQPPLSRSNAGGRRPLELPAREGVAPPGGGSAAAAALTDRGAATTFPTTVMNPIPQRRCGAQPCLRRSGSAAAARARPVGRPPSRAAVRPPPLYPRWRQ